MKYSPIPLSELTKNKNNPEIGKIRTQIDQTAPEADRERPHQVGRCILKIPTHHLSILRHQIVDRPQDQQCEIPRITNTDQDEVPIQVHMTVNIQLQVKS